jgi:hypothetical protein
MVFSYDLGKFEEGVLASHFRRFMVGQLPAGE